MEGKENEITAEEVFDQRLSMLEESENKFKAYHKATANIIKQYEARITKLESDFKLLIENKQ